MTRLAALFTGSAFTLAFALAFVAPLQAKTASKSQSSQAKKASGEAGKSGKVGKIKFMQGSAETTKERSTRLSRECKGRPNAGACEGYTR